MSEGYELISFVVSAPCSNHRNVARGEDAGLSPSSGQMYYVLYVEQKSDLDSRKTLSFLVQHDMFCTSIPKDVVKRTWERPSAERKNRRHPCVATRYQYH